jgi:hypothetical protein
VALVTGPSRASMLWNASETTHRPARWAPVVTAIEDGSANWDSLTAPQRLLMPIQCIIRCKAAERRRDPGRTDGTTP